MCSLEKVGSYLPLVFSFLQGLLTPVIAVIAVYIAYQQWKTNALKLKLDLYDRRFHVFDAVKEILRIIIGTGDVKTAELAAFVSKTTQAGFLFGEEVTAYVDEVYRHGVNLSTQKEQLRAAFESGAGPETRRPSTEAMDSEMQWALRQPEEIRKKFGRYLDVNKL